MMRCVEEMEGMFVADGRPNEYDDVKSDEATHNANTDVFNL